MTTLQTDTSTSTGTARHRQGADGVLGERRLTFAGVVRSEWIKLISLRATWYSLGSTLVVILGFGAIAASVTSGSVDPGAGAPSSPGGDPVATVLGGAMLGLLLLGVTGALAGAREYSSGMIRMSFAAVPRRLPVLWAKALVFVGLTLPVVLVGVLGAFFLGMAILSNGGAATVSWTDPGVIRAVLGQAGYVVAIGLIGLSLGLLVRGVAASIGLLVGGVLILPQFAGLLLPDSWDSVLRYLPSNAGSAFTTVDPGSSLLGSGTGALVLAGWVALALAGAAVAIRRRDV